MKMNRAQLSWLLYDPANSAYALIVRTVFAPMFFLYCAVPPLTNEVATGYWGYAASISGIVAGLISLRLGSWADQKSFKKRLLGGSVYIGIGLLTVLLFFGQGKPWSVLLLLSGSLVCYMVSNTFFDSLLADVAPRGARHKYSSLSYAAGYVGGVIPFLLCLGLSFVIKDHQGLMMKISFLVAALWWGGLTLPLLRNVKEHKNRNTQQKSGYLDVCLMVLKNRNVLLFLIAYFLYIDGVGTIYLMATPLAISMKISSAWLLLTILGLQFLAFPCTIAFGKLADRFSARAILYVGIGVYALIAVLAFFLPHIPSIREKQILFVIMAVLIGTSQGGVQALSRSAFSRLIPRKNAAAFFGVYNFFGKFTTILGPCLVGIAIRLWGQPEYGISLLLIPFLAGAFLLSLVNMNPERP